MQELYSILSSSFSFFSTCMYGLYTCACLFTVLMSIAATIACGYGGYGLLTNPSMNETDPSTTEDDSDDNCIGTYLEFLFLGIAIVVFILSHIGWLLCTYGCIDNYCGIVCCTVLSTCFSLPTTLIFMGTNVAFYITDCLKVEALGLTVLIALYVSGPGVVITSILILYCIRKTRMSLN